MGEIRKTEETKKAIYKAINEANLPVNVLYYMMKTIMNEVSSAYDYALRQEEQQELLNVKTSTKETKTEEEAEEATEIISEEEISISEEDI
jgi:hypothetical protein